MKDSSATSSDFDQPIRVNFISLGCAKNLVDTEKMLATLAEGGLGLVGPDDPADVTIINTCSFIESARQEAFETIDEVIELKHTGQTGCIVVTGCLAQQWAEKLKVRLPEIDAVVGLSGRAQIDRIVKELVQHPEKTANDRVFVDSFRGPVQQDRGRLRITDPGWAYLRVSEGCNQGCTFCTIPAIRGPFRSKDPDEILAEAAELISDGVLEINLIGQETTGYGYDINYPDGLAGLLTRINDLPGLEWLRVLYAHPASLTDSLIATMADCAKVLPYIDLPLQHINDRLLKLMNRHINRAQTETLIQKLRDRIKNLTLRTTLIVGFPSETDQEFQELLDFVKATRFEALGAFPYSPEAGTAAARLNNHLPDDLKQQRLDELMLAQQQIAFEQADVLVGQSLPCLLCRELSDYEIDQLNLDDQLSWFAARHRGQAPEMDSLCYLAAEDPVEPDKIVPAAITSRDDYDLLGNIQID
ncbi:MAG: 30S ribosomal protein S12 methylthiotransferase RimO [Sedimentisphaerales bacterium]|nr:30S ribosomal protein S12 methylthiotransferase RimO [Sedimentisphaerales bacterium]